jgi:hypothetical protein
VKAGVPCGREIGDRSVFQLQFQLQFTRVRCVPPRFVSASNPPVVDSIPTRPTLSDLAERCSATIGCSSGMAGGRP